MGRRGRHRSPKERGNFFHDARRRYAEAIAQGLEVASAAPVKTFKTMTPEEREAMRKLYEKKP